MQSPKPLPTTLFLTRLAYGWYFLYAGWGKVQGELDTGFGSFLRSETFQSRSPSWIPEIVLAPYGYALPWAELIFGALLILGLFSRVASIAIMCMLVSIGIALLDSGELFPRHHVLLFTPSVLLLCLLGPGALNLDQLRKR